MGPETGKGLLNGITQKTVRIRDWEARSPLHIRSGSMMGGIFTAPVRVLRAMLPNALYAPFEPLRGYGLVGIHCMEYRDTDIGPYNEVALVIATQYDRSRTPGIAGAMASTLRRNWHGYVVDLPVTTEVAVHGGTDFFNYPKYLADISFRETATHRVCTVRCPETMDLIVEFEGRRLLPHLQAVKRLLPYTVTDMNLFTYPVVNGRVMRARTHIRPRQDASTFAIPDADVRVGNCLRSGPWQRLRPGRLVQYMYVPEFEGILYEPEEVTT